MSGRDGLATAFVTRAGWGAAERRHLAAETDDPGRVSKAQMDLAARFGRQADDGIHVNHDLTQEELAQLVGASRETVNKALADFASRGWVRLEPRSVIILDIERLKRRSR